MTLVMLLMGSCLAWGQMLDLEAGPGSVSTDWPTADLDARIALLEREAAAESDPVRAMMRRTVTALYQAARRDPRPGASLAALAAYRLESSLPLEECVLPDRPAALQRWIDESLRAWAQTPMSAHGGLDATDPWPWLTRAAGAWVLLRFDQARDHVARVIDERRPDPLETYRLALRVPELLPRVMLRLHRLADREEQAVLELRGAAGAMGLTPAWREAFASLDAHRPELVELAQRVVRILPPVLACEGTGLSGEMLKTFVDWRADWRGQYERLGERAAATWTSDDPLDRLGWDAALNLFEAEGQRLVALSRWSESVNAAALWAGDERLALRQRARQVVIERDGAAIVGFDEAVQLGQSRDATMEPLRRAWAIAWAVEAQGDDWVAAMRYAHQRQHGRELLRRNVPAPPGVDAATWRRERLLLDQRLATSTASNPLTARDELMLAIVAVSPASATAPDWLDLLIFGIDPSDADFARLIRAWHEWARDGNAKLPPEVDQAVKRSLPR